MQMSYKFTNVLNEGTKVDGFNMKLYLSTQKPLHTDWVEELYNEMF